MNVHYSDRSDATVYRAGRSTRYDSEMIPTDEARKLHAEADRMIRAIYTGQMGWAARERAEQQKRGAAFAVVREDGDATAALHRLVHGLKGRTRLLAIEPLIPGRGPQPGNTGLDALLHVARFS